MKTIQKESGESSFPFAITFAHFFVMSSSPVFVSSIQEFKNDSSQDIFGFYHVCMGTIITGLHILTICSCITVYDAMDNIFVIRWPRNFIAVAGTDSLSRRPAFRNITNVFAHRYCGGVPRLVDLAVVKVDKPWEPTQKFGVAPLGIETDKSYFDYRVKIKDLTTYDCQTYSWINRGSIEEEWKNYDNDTRLKDNSAYIMPKLEECYPFNFTYPLNNTVIPVRNSKMRDDKFCINIASPNGCGVDKGAPMICRKSNQILVAGIGLGAAKCTDVNSLSLFQGFKDSLSFLRLYLAVDDTLLPNKRKSNQDGPRSWSFYDDYV